MRYKTTGNPGSRVFTFEWAHAQWFNDSDGAYTTITPYDSALSFELKLYEGINVIEFCYKDEVGVPASRTSASIGLTGNSIQGGGFISLQSTSALPSVSNQIETDTLSSPPINNQVYKFTPVHPCKSPINVQYDSYTNNTITLSCSAADGVSRYEFAAVTASYPPDSITAAIGNKIISSLQPDTLYHLFARSYCSDSSQSPWIGVVNSSLEVTTASNPVNLPYYEGFENNFLENVRFQDAYDTSELGDYLRWFVASNNPEYAYDGSGYLYIKFYLNTLYNWNSWFFLPGMKLTADKAYKFKFHYTTHNLANPNKLEVKYGKAVGALAMTSGTLFRDTAINTVDVVWLSDSTIFSTATSDTYYIGFHCFSDSGKGSLLVDAISVEDEGVLPVTFINLSGETNGKQNLLHWTTATEENNIGFEVQRSIDGNNFSKARFLNTKAINGNSSLKLNYDFADITFSSGVNYYRLKQVDKDGKFTYSNIVVLKDDNALADGEISVYPNPSKNTLNIKIASSGNDKLKLLVTDMSGKILLTKPTLVSNGETIIQLNVSHLSAGTYLLKLMSADNNEKAIMKFIKQ